MLDWVKSNAKKNYEDLIGVIDNCQTKTDLINKMRGQNVIIDEYNNRISILKDELKIVINIDNGIVVEKILVFDENYEEYIDLF